jgi:muconolactone delta-isomerase
MQFLVELDIALPPMQSAERELLFAAERTRGEALRAAGSIERIWRVADRPANVGIWQAPDAGVLDGLLRSLPFHPYLTVRVTPLEPHLLDAGGDG